MREKYKALYEQLKGTYTKKGKLVVEGFDHDMYEDLYWGLIEEMKPSMRGDYWEWYRDAVKQYYNYRKSTNQNDYFRCPQMDKPLDEHTIQEQLAVFKIWLYRKSHNRYLPKE